eukprot:gnl/TRDRNA2_/TRDRNA2_189510_c0_seq1.p1 gnl/TRDRNA2_/TRDRNA2_189510_c0~~gnl/TRDRNA2_/TRDRNA2_189510_c0_seq1.p1  ORF type:complete len:318 (+),score=41.86 gnl/TRDRNA2_/TRDRNA2_189510_c0_seq1:58-1011(+)
MALDDELAETRSRAAAINRLVDMIPARFYVGEEQGQGQGRRNWDKLNPWRAKPTSRIAEEAAAASASTSSTGSNREGRSRKRKGKRERARSEGRKPESSPARRSGSPGPRGLWLTEREYLIKLLKERIRELRRAKPRRYACDKGQDACNSERRSSKTAMRSPKLSARRPPPLSDDDIDIRVSYTPRTSAIPYEASVNPRGTKARRRQEDLWQAEEDGRRIAAAGEAERHVIEMNKAMMRARGEKVHDDPSRLRKAERAMQQRKQKSKEQWASRTQAEKQQQDERQQRRKENLQTHRGNKKPRHGFEGQRTGFLNMEY